MLWDLVEPMCAKHRETATCFLRSIGSCDAERAPEVTPLHGASSRSPMMASKRVEMQRHFPAAVSPANPPLRVFESLDGQPRTRLTGVFLPTNLLILAQLRSQGPKARLALNRRDVCLPRLPRETALKSREIKGVCCEDGPRMSG